LDRFEGDPAVALEQLAGTRRETRIVEALVLEMAIHPIEPWGDPAASRLQEADPDLRKALARAAPDDGERDEHHLHRVRDDVAGAPPLEAIDADGRHAARGALVEADREVELLRLLPESVVVRVIDHSVVVRVGPEEAAPHPELLASEAHLVDGRIDR